MKLEPNEHGVWPYELAEHLTLPRNKKGWQGGPIAEIALLETPHGWLSSADYMLMGEAGGCYGLMTRPDGSFFPDRASALADAKDYLYHSIQDYPDNPDAKAIRSWLYRDCRPREQQQELVL